MPRTGEEPQEEQAALLRELRQAVGELRADLLVTQAALALLAAEVAQGRGAGGLARHAER
jgi:hypothetical protein